MIVVMYDFRVGDVMSVVILVEIVAFVSFYGDLCGILLHV